MNGQGHMNERVKTIMIRTTGVIFAVLLITLFLRADFLQFETPFGRLSMTTAKNAVIAFNLLCLPAVFIYLFKNIKERSLFSVLLTLAFVLMSFSCFFTNLRFIPGSGKPFVVPDKIMI